MYPDNKPPQTFWEWLGEVIATGCVIALPFLILIIGTALGLH